MLNKNSRFIETWRFLSSGNVTHYAVVEVYGRFRGTCSLIWNISTSLPNYTVSQKRRLFILSAMVTAYVGYWYVSRLTPFAVQLIICKLPCGTWTVHQGCTNPWRQNFVRWRLIFVDPQYGPWCVWHYWRLEVAPRLSKGWTARGSNPSGGEMFHAPPDRPWSPPSL